MQVVEENVVNAPGKDASMLSRKDIVSGSSIKNESRYSYNNSILLSSGGIGGKSEAATSLALQQKHAPTLD